MPADAVMRSTRPVTHSELVAGLRALGVRTGCGLMVHTRMGAIGWIVGASETVVRALLEALGSDGTLLAYVGWNDNTCRMDECPLRWQDAYRSQRPPFDPLCSEADPQMGRVPERIRTWPGAVASGSH
jgi:aminoglycoside 3-N-acetyltransferase